MTAERIRQASIEIKYAKLLEEHIALTRHFDQLLDELTRHAQNSSVATASMLARINSAEVVIDALKEIAIGAIGEAEVARRLAVIQEDIERGL